MNDPKSHQEPSMEEILASIRRIISENDVIEKEDQDSTLREVGQVPLVETKGGVTIDGSKGRDLELIEDIETEPSTVKQTVNPLYDTGLISPPPFNEAVSQLSLVAPAERLGQSMGVSACTIQDLMTEIMRPMVKEWLDNSLPALVKRLVRRELGRNSRRAVDGIDD